MPGVKDLNETTFFKGNVDFYLHVPYTLIFTYATYKHHNFRKMLNNGRKYVVGKHPSAGLLTLKEC
jgi:hypothetical protein